MIFISALSCFSIFKIEPRHGKVRLTFKIKQDSEFKRLFNWRQLFLYGLLTTYKMQGRVIKQGIGHIKMSIWLVFLVDFSKNRLNCKQKRKRKTIRYQFDTIQYDYDALRYDTIRYDTIRYDTIRYDTIQFTDFKQFIQSSQKEPAKSQLEVGRAILPSAAS